LTGPLESPLSLSTNLRTHISLVPGRKLISILGSILFAPIHKQFERKKRPKKHYAHQKKCNEKKVQLHGKEKVKNSQ
jgi:hypothetical protein